MADVVDFLEPREPGSPGPGPAGADAGDQVTEAHLDGERGFYRGEFETAVEEYRHALRLDPTHFASHVGLVDSLIELERAEEAVDHVNAALGRYNRNTLLGAAGAHAAAHSGRLQSAMEYIGVSREHNPGHAYVWLVQAEVDFAIGDGRYVSRGKQFQPTYCYRKSAELAGDTRVWNMRTGMSLAEWGRHAEALVYFRKAIDARAASPYLYLLAGRCYEALDRGAEAVESYRHALEIDPAYHRAREALRPLARVRRARRWIGRFFEEG
jgi:tetratricopeptide (TPR) repeat protein